MAGNKTVIVTGASQGIGAAITRAFLDRGYNVLATAQKFSGAELAASPSLALVEGDIRAEATADKIIQSAMATFGSIEALVNNAGIFFGKPFTEYTVEEFGRFVSINMEGFFLVTQRAVRQMLARGRGGSVTTITAALADNPMAGHPASIAMMTKGGLNAITRSLAMEYAPQHIRFNAVAPGVVDTPLQQGASKESLADRTPMGTISEPADIAAAVLYLTEASHVTGEVLYVDDGAHVGRW
jgi:NAD(P)-dependent dehydrogenase (short-subunit alcohol dehydrogenase family)